MDIRKLQKAIVDGLEDVKAQNIVVFDTEALSPLFERVIIASGTSNRQTKALAASVRDVVKALGEPVPRVEGEENGEWIIVDCGAAVAHIMQPAIREYYHLEEIWGMSPVALKSAVRKARSGLPKAEEPAAPSKKPKPAAGKIAAPRKTATQRKTASAPQPAARKTPAAKKSSAVPSAAPRAAAKAPAARPARPTVATKAAKPAAAAAKKAVAKKAASSKLPAKSAAKVPAARKRTA
jgi:ribosome-associated protein